jgi:3-hydroxy acid dehydrogenase/malonic semialdehyde reductase
VSGVRACRIEGWLTTVSGEDIAEEIVWAASRPDHVNIAQVRKWDAEAELTLVILPVSQATATISHKSG